MKMAFDVQTPNLENAKESTKEKAKEVLWRCMVKMEELAKMRAPVDTGLLKARIHLEPMQSGASEYILSDGVDYGIHVEYGTKPHYVPIAPLLGWAGRVLKDKGAAYAVRAKISQFGIPAQPFFIPALHEVQFTWLPIFKKQVFGK